MKSLEDLLSDFYDLLEIPIQFLDKNLKLISSKGYSDKLFRLCDDLGILNNIDRNSSSTVKINSSENIHFIIIPKFNLINQKGYFVVGPFKSESMCKEHDIPFKPLSCSDYFSSVLETIIKNKYHKKHKFSVYVKEGIDYIHRNYYNDINLGTVCDHLNINKSYFCSIFKNETGYTFSNFLNKLRVEKSKEFLLENDESILDIALSVGYNNHTYYSSVFKKYNGMSPQEYRHTTLQ